MHGWRRYDGGSELQRAVRLACSAAVTIWDQDMDMDQDLDLDQGQEEEVGPG